MATNPMSETLQHLRRSALLPDAAGMTDGELLEGFVTRRDKAALAGLIRRHGPMVWGVCRRVLPNHHDAEDAFQATFLVLVRKAATVQPRERVGNWLYGVAHQTALNARAEATRRRTRQRSLTALPEPAGQEPDLRSALQPVLDQELSRLPGRYRAAIVLCDLEEKTRKDAAQQLGIPEGTLSGWLARGRAMLARRLARHGLGVSSVALAAVLSQSAVSAGDPIPAISASLHAASLGTAGAFSARVALLVESVAGTAVATKMKIAAAVLLILAAALGTGIIYRGQAATPTEQPTIAASGGAAPKPEPSKAIPREGKRAPKFTLGKATTYVTGPLNDDGYIDYETALNERLVKGITPENNANVLLWQAIRPHPLGMTMPAEYFRWLKMPEPAERGDYFIGPGQYGQGTLKLTAGEPLQEFLEKHDRATRRAWVEKDFPPIAGWLAANEKPLGVVLAATRRPEYCNPQVAQKSGDAGWLGLVGAVSPQLSIYRELASALLARAMLRAGEGRFDEARQDLMACHRLGRLIARGPNFVEHLAGVVIDLNTSRADLALLDRAQPTVKQARAWVGDLQQLPPMPPLTDRVDLGERFLFLQMVTLVRRSPARTFNLLLKTLQPLAGKGEEHPNERRPGDPPAEPPRTAIDALDWDVLLRTGNVWYDRIAAAERLGDRAAREKELGRIRDEVHALRDRAGEPAEVLESLRSGKESGKEASARFGNLLLVFLPAFRAVQNAADRAEQEQRNLHLALALAAYRRDQGRYPEKLEALAPEYLKEVPNDLFSSKPLNYYPAKDGYLLYSIGVNGKDDGGRRQDDTPPGDDITVRMPLPELPRK
jgi:RNA polymerase sigma factor (sigma-70 family)